VRLVGDESAVLSVVMVIDITLEAVAEEIVGCGWTFCGTRVATS
jgi:hypothetical protein